LGAASFASILGIDPCRIICMRGVSAVVRRQFLNAI
jgi:hypothetical protein